MFKSNRTCLLKCILEGMNYVTHDKLPGWMQLEMILNNGWKLERASQLELLTSVKFTYTKPAELLYKNIVFKLQIFLKSL